MCKETAVLNGLSDHYAEILGPKYAELYRQNIGRRNYIILPYNNVHRLTKDVCAQLDIAWLMT